MDFSIKSSNGKTTKVVSDTLVAVEDYVIQQLATQKDGSFYNINLYGVHKSTVTRDRTASHHTHGGYKFTA